MSIRVLKESYSSDKLISKIDGLILEFALFSSHLYFRPDKGFKTHIEVPDRVSPCVQPAENRSDHRTCGVQLALEKLTALINNVVMLCLIACCPQFGPSFSLFVN